MSGLDDLLVEGRNIIGAPYAWWGGGELEHGAPEYMGEGYGPGYVRANGVNCSGILNWLRQWVSLGPVGGTLAYGEFLDPRADYDPSRWYPVGTVCVQRYIEGVSEGHMGIVSNANQLMLQSDAYYGVNELKTAAAQHGYSPFDWAGWMPGMPNADYLPGWTASQGVAGYPGDEATPQQTAAWMGRVAEHIYGLPAELPVMCSLVELTQGWTGPGDVKDVAGYLYAVDYDSLGWFQQRPAAGWGTPEQITDPEYALAAFLDAAWDAGPPGGPPYPEDAASLGEWIANVQRPREDLRYKYGTPENHGWAVSLLENNPDLPQQTNQQQSPRSEGASRRGGGTRGGAKDPGDEEVRRLRTEVKALRERLERPDERAPRPADTVDRKQRP